MTNDEEQGIELSNRDLEQYFENLKAPEIQDAAAVEEQILRALLKAHTPEEIFKGGTLTKASDILSIPLTMRDVRYNRSSYDSREGAYAVIDAVRQDTGEVIAIGCGARKVMVQAFVLKREGLLPTDVAIVENPTANGYSVMSLVPIEKASA
jgi:hypothetical protein